MSEIARNRDKLTNLIDNKLWDELYCECKRLLLHDCKVIAEIACQTFPLAIYRAFGENYKKIYRDEINKIDEGLYHKDYFVGLYLYLDGRIEEGLRKIELSRQEVSKYILEWKYSDSSIRGVLSAVDFNLIKSIEKSTPKDRESEIKSENLNKYKTIICLSMDSVYFNKYFSIFYQSISKSLTDCFIVAKIINPTELDKNTIEDKHINKNIEFIYENINASSLKPYLISARFLLASQVLNLCENNVIVCDVDALLTEKTQEFINSTTNSISIKYSKGLYPWRNYGAGFLYIINNKKTKEIFNMFCDIFWLRYLQDIDPRGNKQWWIDQYILSSLLDYYIVNYNLDINKLNDETLPILYPSSLDLTKDQFIIKYSN